MTWVDAAEWRPEPCISVLIAYFPNYEKPSQDFYEGGIRFAEGYCNEKEEWFLIVDDGEDGGNIESKDVNVVKWTILPKINLKNCYAYKNFLKKMGLDNK